MIDFFRCYQKPTIMLFANGCYTLMENVSFCCNNFDELRVCISNRGVACTNNLENK